MKKRPIRILPLSLALAMSVTLAAPVSAASLSDVAGPYAQSIEALAEKGIIKGDGTGAYHPEAPLTRSAAASLLYEAFCLVPVFSMEAPAPEANEDGRLPWPPWTRCSCPPPPTRWGPGPRPWPTPCWRPA